MLLSSSRVGAAPSDSAAKLSPDRPLVAFAEPDIDHRVIEADVPTSAISNPSAQLFSEWGEGGEEMIRANNLMFGLSMFALPMFALPDLIGICNTSWNGDGNLIDLPSLIGHRNVSWTHGSGGDK